MKKQTNRQATPSKVKTRKQAVQRSLPANFSGHIAELRRRLFWVAVVFLVASSLAYNFREALLAVVMAPLHGQKLSYLTPAGGFSFIFQISMYTGLFASLPVLIYQLHAFIRPALPEQARKSAFKVVVAASVLITGGISYGYFIAIPAALEFLTTFASNSVVPSLTADSYLSFFLAYVAGIAGLSLLPLFLLFVHWITPLKPKTLWKSERWVIAGAFIVAAFITPTPDAVNQTMIAVPIILIYQLGVIAVLISWRKVNKQARAQSRRQARDAEASRRRQELLQNRRQTVTPMKPASVVSRPLLLQENVMHAPVKVMAAAISKPAVDAHSKTAMVSMDVIHPRKQAAMHMDIAPARSSSQARAVRMTPAPRQKYPATSSSRRVVNDMLPLVKARSVASRTRTVAPPIPRARQFSDIIIATD